MTATTAEWSRYSTWNDAVATIVYSLEAAGTPVYLDLDDDLLPAIGAVAEPAAADPGSALCHAVSGTLSLGHGPSEVFDEHRHRLDEWYDGSMLHQPPTLALLAMLSLAAETMHDGEGMKPHNFYGRLGELLDLSHQELKRFQTAYHHKIAGQAVSAMLWDSLNDWLEMLEGNRGLPTAYAVGHEHIGPALSQALVRRTDRDRFGDLFALNGLPPRSTLSLFDMESLIGDWMSRTPCPASNVLERLWSKSTDVRRRIAAIAVQALQSWDGDTAPPSTNASSRATLDPVRARAILRSFPSRRLDLSLVVPACDADDAELLEVLDGDGFTVGELELVLLASGYMGLANPGAIDTRTFLEAQVRLRRVGQDRPLRRRPRRLVPLRHDDLLGAYVECERVQLGEESLLLARSEIAGVVDEVLHRISRPGFTVIDRLDGLPLGWTLISGVQVMSSMPWDVRKSVPVDLNALQPLTSSQVLLRGGLRLPGNIAKWSTAIPPELRASVDSEVELSASITCTRDLFSPPPEERTRQGGGAVLIWDLADEELPDGDYQVGIYEDGSLSESTTLRLRSADSPAVVVEPDLAPIARDLERSPVAALAAARTASVGAFSGVPTTGPALPPSEPPSVPDWYRARQDRPRRREAAKQIHFPLVADDSCIVTGAHHMDLESATAGKTTVEGICRSCGLIKRYPATRGKRKGRQRRPAGGPKLLPENLVSSLDPVRESESIDWRAAFDAVCHVGAGTASSLELIASQMEATGLFGDAFERRLELMGHIEIERGPHSLAPNTWEVVAPHVIGLPQGSAALMGFRSERMMAAVDDHVWACGGKVRTTDVDGPRVIHISGLSEEQLEQLAGVMSDASRRQARFVPLAAEHLCAVLPPLSQARLGLPTTTSIQAQSYEAWNPAIARFEPADSASKLGAFRLTGFNRTYIYRTGDDFGALRATLGDARVVKYLAAADLGRSLLGYDHNAQILYVPLGADLPGLYGRAAALASGSPPVENEDERILEYHHVPPGIAGHLNYLLMS